MRLVPLGEGGEAAAAGAGPNGGPEGAAEGAAAGAAATSSAAAAGDGSGAEPMDEDELLQQALAMSMGADEPTAGERLPPITSSFYTRVSVKDYGQL